MSNETISNALAELPASVASIDTFLQRRGNRRNASDLRVALGAPNLKVGISPAQPVARGAPTPAARAAAMPSKSPLPLIAPGM